MVIGLAASIAFEIAPRIRHSAPYRGRSCQQRDRCEAAALREDDQELTSASICSGTATRVIGYASAMRASVTTASESKLWTRARPHGQDRDHEARTGSGSLAASLRGRRERVMAASAR